MGFDGSSIKKRKIIKNEATDSKVAKGLVFSEQISSISLNSSPSWLLRSVKLISSILGILFILIYFTPFFQGLATMKNADESEQAFERKAENRINAVEQSLSSLDLSDKNLLQCVRNAVLERGKIHSTETGGIDHFRELPMLTCMETSIASIAGISALQGLTYLNLDNNDIENIYELREMNNLEIVSLAGNPVQNIIILSEIASLRKVVLPDLPETYCYQIHQAVQSLESNVDAIKCKGKWSLEIQEISDRKIMGRPLSDEEENLLYDYRHNQSFMPNK